MRRLVPLLLLVSCSPSIEKVREHDSSMTDSALSVLSSIERLRDTVMVETVKTIVVESGEEVRPMYSIERRVDTVFIFRVDTVWVSR